MAKITDSKLRTERTKRKLFDANGLYALRSKNGDTWWWRIRLIAGKREQHLSLGTWPDTSLDEARIGAATVKKASKNGEDAALVAAKLRGAPVPRPTKLKPEPSGDAIESVVEQWQQWIAGKELAASTLKRDDRCLTYLVNALGAGTSMSTVDAPTLQDAIERIEQAHGNEMPRRSLRLANGLWRFAMGKRIVSNNPASGLASRDFLKPYAKRKFAAITDPKKFGDLLRAIDGHTGQPVTRIALQLLARTFVRPGELRLAKWSEFNLDNDVPQWVIPQGRMKMRRDPESSDHVVPLATQSVALLRSLQQHRVDDLAFPSLRKGRPLADATFTAALRTLGFDGSTHVAHGFRTSASSLLHGLGFDPELVETQLAHKRPGVRGVYFRAHLLPERRNMMQRWADYLDELRQQNS